MKVSSMLGLGDNIYQRAFIKNIKEEIWLSTPWPQLYKDLHHVRFTQSHTQLRTQAKNERQQDAAIYSSPQGRDIGRVSYGADGIFNGMRKFFKVEPSKMDLPDFGDSCISGDYVVVRPLTIRSEWVAASRNPDNQYLIDAVNYFKSLGLKTVSIADLEPGKEWLSGDNPACDVYYHRGELSVEQLMALVKNAKYVVGGTGWILPACIAYNVPVWIICGGQFGYNSPNMITDKSQNLEKVGFAIPDKPCYCKQRDHKCDKRISNHEDQLRRWVFNLG